MWPFKKKATSPEQSITPEAISFSQVDMTDRFGDNLALQPNDWIETAPLNARIKNPKSMGLPPSGATEEDAYRVADRPSRLRESMHIANDGGYCPICHITNTQLSLLGWE